MNNMCNMAYILVGLMQKTDKKYNKQIKIKSHGKSF